MTISKTEAYNLGFASGRRNAATIKQAMEATFAGWRAGYPLVAEIDLAQEFLRLDKERLDATPSYTKFPEARGWADLIVAERQGFAEGSGAGPAEVAFHFNRLFFMACRLDTRYIGHSTAPPPTGECTAIFIRESAEGGPLYGRNMDSPYSAELDIAPPRRGPDGERRLWFKGVSCWTMCDEEPEEIFPLQAWRALPDDCRKLDDVVDFMTRYVEFWWACNGIIVDADLDCIAFERSNRRIGWRRSDNGTAAVTACAQIIPEMNAFRDSCLRQAMTVRGGTAERDGALPDWAYWKAAEDRYHHLMKLVKDAAGRNPSLQDLAAIMIDHAGTPRMCLMGESCHPAIPVGAGEWTMRSRAAVMHGPNRRTLFYNCEGKRPCYQNQPYLIPGDGVDVDPKWLVGTQPLPVPEGPDDDLEAYRQYEFDWPESYPV